MKTFPSKNIRHVAVIMDGNGRWANEKKMPRSAGHRAGASNVRRVVDKFKNIGLKYLTLYAFSTENWARPEHEIDTIMELLVSTANNQLADLDESNIKIVHIGDKMGLDPKVKRSIETCEDITRDNTEMTLCIAFNYGGRAELLNAIKILLSDPNIKDHPDEELIEKHLYTHNIPDPDLIIRTAGEMRLSNFLIWQSAYSEYYSTETLWPDFDEHEIELALHAYKLRTRKYGTISE